VPGQPPVDTCRSRASEPKRQEKKTEEKRKKGKKKETDQGDSRPWTACRGPAGGLQPLSHKTNFRRPKRGSWKIQPLYVPWSRVAFSWLGARAKPTPGCQPRPDGARLVRVGRHDAKDGLALGEQKVARTTSRPSGLTPQQGEKNGPSRYRKKKADCRSAAGQGGLPAAHPPPKTEIAARRRPANKDAKNGSCSPHWLLANNTIGGRYARVRVANRTGVLARANYGPLGWSFGTLSGVVFPAEFQGWQGTLQLADPAWAVPPVRPRPKPAAEVFCDQRSLPLAGQKRRLRHAFFPNVISHFRVIRHCLRWAGGEWIWKRGGAFLDGVQQDSGLARAHGPGGPALGNGTHPSPAASSAKPPKRGKVHACHLPLCGGSWTPPRLPVVISLFSRCLLPVAGVRISFALDDRGWGGWVMAWVRPSDVLVQTT